MSPKFTIITVVLNADADLFRTIKSVKAQSYTNFEVIIVEGGSPSPLLLDYVNLLPDKYRFVSERDAGIYDAMNKGVRLVRGSYICFLNAGDTFTSNNVLKEVDGSCGSPAPAVVYGDFRIIRDKRTKNVSAASPHAIRYKMLTCHQSIFFRSDILPSPCYSETYAICADYNLMCMLYKDGYKFIKIKKTICDFKSGGISEKKVFDRNREEYAIAKRHFGISLPLRVFSITRTLKGYVTRKIFSSFYRQRAQPVGTDEAK
jgi:putative colanic acid biosynthesis glycosyltransferase